MASEIGALSHLFRDIDGFSAFSEAALFSGTTPWAAGVPYLHRHHSSPSSYFLTKFGFNIFQMP